MTTPTPAQIEAAAAEIMRLMEGVTSPRQLAQAALHAAAEVGPVGLIATHQGESDPSVRPDYSTGSTAAAIERCAQVADNFDGFDWDEAHYAIAAAIRALKDKP